MIRFACSCGRELQARDDLAGRDVRCPSCQELQTVPYAEAEPPSDAVEAIQDEAPRRRSSREREQSDDYGESVEATSGQAAWSLGLGIGSFFCTCFTGIPAIILGALALTAIGRSRGRLGGQGMAITGIVLGSITTFCAGPFVSIGLLLPAVQRVRETAAKVASQSNLKQMVLAMHNYASDVGTLPPVGGGEMRNANLSWRVALLPYLGEDDLYRQFHLDEPWDSPHNRTLLALMPKVYRMAALEDAPGMTHYRVFMGEQAAFAAPGEGGKAPVARRLDDFPDGLDKTILIVEATEAVPWTKPDELVFAPNAPLPRLGPFNRGGNVGMADGSVRILPPNYPDAELRALITRNGGERVDLP